MKSKHVFFTKTMGDLYLKQGYVDDAENVFAALLKKDPRRTDCDAGLSMCARQRRIDAAVKAGDLEGLVRRWVDLVRKAESFGRP